MSNLPLLLLAFSPLFLSCSSRHDKVAEQIQEYVINSNVTKKFIEERQSEAIISNVVAIHPYYKNIDFSHLSNLHEENRYTFDTAYDSSSIDSLLQQKDDIRIDKSLFPKKRRFTIYLTPPFKGICYAILVDVENDWISSLGDSMSPVSGSWLEFLFEIKNGVIENLYEDAVHYKD